MGLFSRKPPVLFEGKQVTSRDIAVMIAAFATVPVEADNAEDPDEMIALVKKCKRIKARADAHFYNYPSN